MSKSFPRIFLGMASGAGEFMVSFVPGRADSVRIFPARTELDWIRAFLRNGTWAGVLALALACGHAQAAPPAEGSEDWQIMHPYQDWIVSQHDRRGYWCCDIGDGRPVEAEIAGDHWRVHVEPRHFPDEVDRWMDVPPDKLTRGGNPTGMPILWLLHGRVQCFAPPDGV